MHDEFTWPDKGTGMSDVALDEAFRNGKDAHRGGVLRADNPFPELSDEALEWFEGWDDAKHDDLEATERDGR